MIKIKVNIVVNLNIFFGILIIWYLKKEYWEVNLYLKGIILFLSNIIILVFDRDL